MAESEPKTKKCRLCAKRLPVTKFTTDRRMKSGRVNECSPCRSRRWRAKVKGDEALAQRTRVVRNAWQRSSPKYRAARDAYNEKNREKILRDKRERRLRSFGLTVEQYDEMLASQGGGCATCGRRPEEQNNGKRLAVDHCHRTGAVRGLLCANCNRSIGWSGDDPGLLRRLADYLEKKGKK